MDEDNNVIKFPVENIRLDLSGIPAETEEIMDKIHDMKKDYFSEVADAIVDDVLRNIECLNLEESRMWRGGLDARDVICIKESIMAGLYRSVGMEHPFHNIMEKTIIGDILSEKYDEAQVYTYVFKDT